MANRLATVARALVRLDGKALPAPSPSGQLAAAGPPIAVDRPTISRISQREARRHLSAYAGDQAIDTVNNCVNVYIDAALSAKWLFERDGEKYIPHRPKDAPPEVKDAPEDLTELFEQPNPYQDWGEWFALALTDFLLVGNFYWLKWRPNGEGKPLGLYRLHPAYVRVIPGSKDLIAGYEYQIPGRAEPVNFPADQVVHGRRPNPHSPYLGVGLVAAGARMLDVELALTDTQASFFEHGALLTGVLQTDRRVPDVVFKKLVTQFRTLYTGSAQAGKVAVLEQGLQFNSIQPTAVDSQFDTLSELSFQRICRLFRMPPELLGGAARPGILQEAKRAFANDTMRPLLNRLQALISLGLTRPAWDLDFVLDYTYTIPREDQLKLVAGFATLPGVTVNEVRQEAGLQPLDPAEKDPDSGKPLGDKVLNLPTPSTELGGLPNRPMPGQPGRPPNGENVPAFPQAPREGRSRGSGAAPRPQGTGAPPHRAAGAKAVRIEDTLKADRDAAVDEVAALIEAGLRSALGDLERALLDHVSEGKGLRKADRPRVLAAIEDSEAWRAFAATAASVLERAAAVAGFQAVSQQATVGHRVNTERIDFEAIAAGLVHREGGLGSISATLRERVVREIAEGVRRGYSTSQIVSGYSPEHYDGLRVILQGWSTGQLKTVALTEATIYHNEGTLRAAEAAGLETVHVHDGDYDVACQEADGAVWTIEHARANRLEHPNCRRGFSL